MSSSVFKRSVSSGSLAVISSSGRDSDLKKKEGDEEVKVQQRAVAAVLRL